MESMTRWRGCVQLCICMVQQERECEYRLDFICFNFRKTLSVWWLVLKVKIAMRKGTCEMLIIEFAHDGNFIFELHVGTVFVYYSSKTFHDNWNFGSKMCLCHWIYLRDWLISRGAILSLMWTKLGGQTFCPPYRKHLEQKVLPLNYFHLIF